MKRNIVYSVRNTFRNVVVDGPVSRKRVKAVRPASGGFIVPLRPVRTHPKLVPCAATRRHRGAAVAVHVSTAPDVGESRSEPKFVLLSRH